MAAVFRSKVDGGLKLVGLISPCVALLAITTAPRVAAVLWLPAIAAVLAATVVVWITLSTYYEFKGELLIAHSGPFAWRIPLLEISTVRESKSARSGPALSMDRLEVRYGNGRVLLISPADKSGFLAVLHRGAPQLARPRPPLSNTGAGAT